MEMSGKKCRKCQVPEAGMASYVPRERRGGQSTGQVSVRGAKAGSKVGENITKACLSQHNFYFYSKLVCFLLRW